MSVAVKICGLGDQESVDAAIEGDADYLGFMFFAASPRHVTADLVATLVEDAPEEVARVGVFVDPSDAELDQVLSHVRLDYIQLHGSESPERIDEIRLAFGLPVIKAIGVSAAHDVEAASVFTDHADMLLFDAKPPPGADRPGGNALAFNWDLMTSYTGTLPWMLAGGLIPETVADAIAKSGAAAVDVSSGVESSPGRKDPTLVTAFLKAAKGMG
ncbi:MAG: phosphoribosylanthranilate isomerase [Alphaproteobacteria bacterium]|nr:phosphoribosylanthranilate isomerase [Alphaproteobacteria bacterium]